MAEDRELQNGTAGFPVVNGDICSRALVFAS